MTLAAMPTLTVQFIDPMTSARRHGQSLKERNVSSITHREE
jgi:hypothetical protein